MLQALLNGGMQIGCLTEPPLHAFLRHGLSGDGYPVERAVMVAGMLVEHGAPVNQRDRQGKRILDVLDDPRWASRVAPLKQALVAMGATRE